jgi:hypothetical protein
MLFSSFEEMHSRLEDNFQRRNTKMRNNIQPVEIMVAAIRQVMFVCALKENFDD